MIIICDGSFCVNLTGLKDAQVAGNTVSLGVTARVFAEETSIWVHNLTE